MSDPVIYHVTPITPEAVLRALAGRCFLVSYARPDQVAIVEEIAKAIIYDNGAFSAHTLGIPFDFFGFIRWVEPRLAINRRAIIPDVIGGSEEDQERLIAFWPFGHAGAPVWHTNETLTRLFRLIEAGWPQICVGSAAEHWEIGAPAWTARMDQVGSELASLGGELPDFHLLRGASRARDYPWIKSADASSLAQNHHRYRKPLFRGTPDEYRGVVAYADRLEGRGRRHEHLSAQLHREVRQQ